MTKQLSAKPKESFVFNVNSVDKNYTVGLTMKTKKLIQKWFDLILY